MNSVIDLYKSLKFGRKVQLIRLLSFIQVLGFQFVLHFAANSQIRFFLESWVALSWFLVIVLLLIEIAYEVKTYDY